MYIEAHNTASANQPISITAAATDPIEPIHEYSIPILPFKQPPSREDFAEQKRHKKLPEPHPQPSHPQDGHVDDFA